MASRSEIATREVRETRILRRKQVEARTGLSRSSIYARLSESDLVGADQDDLPVAAVTRRPLTTPSAAA